MVDKYYEDMRNTIKKYQSQEWLLKEWKKRPALFDKSGKYIKRYSGEEFDSKIYDLIENGWDHEHCEFCWITICDDNHQEHVHQAYESDGNWICPDCYQHLILDHEDPEIYLEPESKSC